MPAAQIKKTFLKSFIYLLQELQQKDYKNSLTFLACTNRQYVLKWCVCGPNLHNAECGGGDRVGEVTTRGRHGAHNAHTALSLRVTCSHQLLI